MSWAASKDRLPRNQSWTFGVPVNNNQRPKQQAKWILIDGVHMKHTVRYLFGLNGQYSMFANRKDLSVHLPRTGQGSCHKWQQLHVEIHIFKCILKLENCSIKMRSKKKTLLKQVKKNHISVGYTPVICKSLITLNIRL